MKFFDRTKEIETLQEILEESKENAQFTVITGRRRIGKTSLVRKAYENNRMLYFFVSRKAEAELCKDFQDEIAEKLNIQIIGKISVFTEILEFILKTSEKEQITLFIDEFQEFSRINKSIFSDMQKLWDKYQNTARINLIVCGSIYSMMTKNFLDKKEPLYNRQTRFINVKPFTPSVLKKILSFYNPDYKPEDLLALFLFTGGVAKYVQLLIDSRATSKEKMIDYIIREDSIFINEGKYILIEEFGKDYGTYFSILSLISAGRTTRTDIENAIGKEIGGYLTKLEKEYEVIKKRQPMHEKTTNKRVQYIIEDNFLCFWFRFIHKYNHIIEIEAYENLKKILNRDYETYSGKMLERYFFKKLVEKQTYTRLSNWWDRKGENEIDIIAENEIEREIDFIEIKRKKENFNPHTLSKKVEVFLKKTNQYKNFTIKQYCLSLEDM